MLLRSTVHERGCCLTSLLTSTDRPCLDSGTGGNSGCAVTAVMGAGLSAVVVVKLVVQLYSSAGIIGWIVVPQLVKCCWCTVNVSTPSG